MKITKHLTYGISIPGHVSEPAAEGFMKDLNKLDAIVGSAVAQVTALNANTLLTQEGKDVERTEILRKAHAAVSAEEKTRQGAQHNLDQRLSTLNSAEKKLNSEQLVARELREQEVRQHLLGVDPVQIEAEAKKALEQRDDVILRAIVNDPISGRLMNKDKVDRIRMERLRLQNPEQAEKIKELETLLEMFDHVVALSRTELRKLGKIPEDDNVQLGPLLLAS